METPSLWGRLLSLDTRGFTLTVEELAKDLGGDASPGAVIEALAHNVPSGRRAIQDGWLLDRGVKRLDYKTKSSLDRFVYEINPRRNVYAEDYVKPSRARGQTCSCPVRRACSQTESSSDHLRS